MGSANHRQGRVTKTEILDTALQRLNSDSDGAVMIKIGPIDFIVKDVTDLRDEDGTKLDGSLLHSSCEILLESDMRPQIRQVTLWHEVVHAILIQAGRRKEAQNEPLIDTLAYGIAAVLRRNKEIK